MTVLNSIKSLFINRTDCYISQYLKDGKKRFVRKDEELTDEVLQKHLDGETLAIGAYQLDKENNVKYGCFDFDKNTEEDYLNAKKLFKWLCFSEFPTVLENSGGGEHKTHLFFFFKPTQASKVRRFMKYACKKVKIKTDDLEIFPKQDEISEDGYGNFVKLPMGIHAETNTKSYFIGLKDIESGLEELERRKNLVEIPEVELDEDIIGGDKNKQEDVSDWDEFFDYCLSRNFPKGRVYDVIQKNHARYLVKKGFTLQTAKEKIEPIYKKNNWVYSDLEGWIKSTLKGEHTEIMKEELVKFANQFDKNMLGLIPWPYAKLEGEINNYTNRQLITHQKKIFSKIALIENFGEKESIIVLYNKRTGISIREIKNELKKYEPAKKKNIVSYDEVLEMKIEKPKFHIDGLIPKGALIFIGGYAGKGKTLLSLYLARQIARGRKVFDQFNVEERGDVLYYDLDSNNLESYTRLQQMARGADEDTKSCKIDFTNEFDRNNLKGEIEQCKKYDIIIIDCYVRMIEGDENHSQVTNTLFIDFLKVLKDQGKTIIVLHHLKKPTFENVALEAEHLFRGSSDIVSQADLTFGIWKLNEKDSEDRKLKTSTFFLKPGKKRSVYFIDPFTFTAVKDENKDCSYFRFGRFGNVNISNKKANKIEDAIIEFLTEKGEQSKQQITDFVVEQVDTKVSTVEYHLTTMRKNKILYSPKYGYYKLTDKDALDNKCIPDDSLKTKYDKEQQEL
jgi:hypothetical protein